MSGLESAVAERAQTPLRGPNAVVRASNVFFSYGGADSFTLQVDSLDIFAGERVALVGPSGCGKTTLVSLLAGVLTPQRGEIDLAGVRVSAATDEQRRALRIRTVGMVFQEFELLEYLSAMDNILLAFHVAPRRAGLTLDRAARQRAQALAQRVGIQHVLHRGPRRLSQGERQRVAICRALVTEPTLVIADEPTGNLDPVSAAATLDLLFEQTRRAGATLLMVTHNHAILDRFDRVLDLPKVAQIGRPA
ncbi:MAG: ATP-binding cassette domain-containing protein [Planctomycetota bacterium]|nr:ATP-binding cassette domain-containing protein [Planctomycetota bacterium]